VLRAKSIVEARKAGMAVRTRCGTPPWASDSERVGIHFVASPRHADLLLVTGPVTRNMALSLLKTYEATPSGAPSPRSVAGEPVASVRTAGAVIARPGLPVASHGQ